MTTNYQTGHEAERHAAEYLKAQGFEVIEINWKTRYCEIDIIARKDGVVFFVEVKHRRDNRFGQGLDYVTPKKQKQMRFAADMWVSNHAWAGDYRLAAIELRGENFEVTQFLDEL
jgi:uncharacterized protein (TIGR00252 family)